jgi:hypothetical protein
MRLEAASIHVLHGWAFLSDACLLCERGYHEQTCKTKYPKVQRDLQDCIDTMQLLRPKI